MDGLKNNWRVICTVLGIVFAVGVAYSNISVSSADISELKEWKVVHEKESVGAFSTIISKLDALKESVDKLEKRVDRR